MHVQCRMILEWSETLLHQISSEKETSGDGILETPRLGLATYFSSENKRLYFISAMSTLTTNS